MTDLPLLEAVFEYGAPDRVFDAFLLLGPVVVVVVAALGRNALTVGLAAGYLLSFLLYVVYKGVERTETGGDRGNGG